MYRHATLGRLWPGAGRLQLDVDLVDQRRKGRLDLRLDHMPAELINRAAQGRDGVQHDGLCQRQVDLEWLCPLVISLGFGATQFAGGTYFLSG